MNFVASVVILLGFVAQQVSCLSATQIRNQIEGYYNARSYLDAVTLATEGSYQALALQATQDALADNSLKNANNVKNYFVAACIHYSTNGVGGWMQDTDYCQWDGIKCYNELELDPFTSIEDLEVEQQKIVDISLREYGVAGTWPHETALLGDHLVILELRDNAYLNCFEYDWFIDMNTLQYLLIGGTAWDANGIPSQLGYLTELDQFHASDTNWSAGPIPFEAFEGLNKLTYIALDNNEYVVTSEEDALAPFARLPSLIRLYFENVRFQDENGNKVVPPLDFLTDLDSVIETWFDQTEFSGGIPNNLPASLRSLKLSYTGISGNLNALLNTQANLERAWLNHNSLSGPIPAAIATKHDRLVYLYLEGNDFNGQVPNAFCDLLVTNGGTLRDLGANENECGSGCCTCSDDACGNVVDVTDDASTDAPTAAPTPVDVTDDASTDAPTAAPTPVDVTVNPGTGFVVCFSGSSTVEVENVGAVKMENLAIGDSVRVGNNKFEPIYSFGHKDSNSTAEYLRITTEGSSAALEISPDHMVAVEGGRHVPASLVKKGDLLLIVTDEFASVTSIKKVMREGAFAPFTASGNIVVNGIVASNYIAYQGSEYVKIGDMETPFSYQFIGHTFNSVHRLAVMVGITGETYTPEGISNWVATAHQMMSWAVGQNGCISSLLIALVLVLLLPLLVFARLVEILLCSPVAMAVVVGGLGLMKYKRSTKKVV